MDVGGREEGTYLVQYVFQKNQYFFLSCTKYILGKSMLRHFNGQPETTEFGIGGKSSFSMPRHVYLGNDSDIPLTGIFDNFPYLFLCIKSLLFFSLAYRSSYLRKTRILPDFYPPSQSFCQMPMEIVHF